MKAQFPVELGCSYMSYLQEGAMAGEVLHSDGSPALQSCSNPQYEPGHTLEDARTISYRSCYINRCFLAFKTTLEILRMEIEYVTSM